MEFGIHGLGGTVSQVPFRQGVWDQNQTERDNTFGIFRKQGPGPEELFLNWAPSHGTQIIGTQKLVPVVVVRSVHTVFMKEFLTSQFVLWRPVCEPALTVLGSLNRILNPRLSAFRLVFVFQLCGTHLCTGRRQQKHAKPFASN